MGEGTDGSTDRTDMLQFSLSLSELEELLFCFENIEKLEVLPGALPDRWQQVGGSGSKKAHLAYLYPLLAKAVKTAGDRWSGAEEVLAPLQETLERLAVF